MITMSLSRRGVGIALALGALALVAVWYWVPDQFFLMSEVRP